jgi:dTDP-4-dehydrorhamnose 3,5-epimerase-like enzyme
MMDLVGTESMFDGLVELIDTQCHIDRRGLLIPFEFDNLPFSPRRIFTISKVPAGTVRGGHGHKTGMQLLVAIEGEIEVTLKTGGQQADLILKPGQQALLIKAGVWAQQKYLYEGSVLMVIASEPYCDDSFYFESGS